MQLAIVPSELQTGAGPVQESHTGLYAAGELTGDIHVNNNLGGNSLLDGVVLCRVAGNMRRNSSSELTLRRTPATHYRMNGSEIDLNSRVIGTIDKDIRVSTRQASLQETSMVTTAGR